MLFLGCLNIVFMSDICFLNQEVTWYLLKPMILSVSIGPTICVATVANIYAMRPRQKVAFLVPESRFSSVIFEHTFDYAWLQSKSLGTTIKTKKLRVPSR